jgi:hypothetical protein
MYLQKITSRKNCVKKLVFAGILKVNDENSRIRIQDPDPGSGSGSISQRHGSADPDPDPHQMSWIRNTGICDHWSTDLPGLYFEPHASTVSVQSPPRLHFLSL